MRKVSIIKPQVVEPEEEITKEIPENLLDQLRYDACPAGMGPEERTKRASSPEIVDDSVMEEFSEGCPGIITERLELASLTIKRVVESYLRTVEKK